MVVWMRDARCEMRDASNIIL